MTTEYTLDFQGRFSALIDWFKSQEIGREEGADLCATACGYMATSEHQLIELMVEMREAYLKKLR